MREDGGSRGAPGGGGRVHVDAATCRAAQTPAHPGVGRAKQVLDRSIARNKFWGRLLLGRSCQLGWWSPLVEFSDWGTEAKSERGSNCHNIATWLHV